MGHGLPPSRPKAKVRNGSAADARGPVSPISQGTLARPACALSGKRVTLLRSVNKKTEGSVAFPP
jgi:hypothetical protein